MRLLAVTNFVQIIDSEPGMSAAAQKLCSMIATRTFGGLSMVAWPYQQASIGWLEPALEKFMSEKAYRTQRAARQHVNVRIVPGPRLVSLYERVRGQQCPPDFGTIGDICTMATTHMSIGDYCAVVSGCDDPDCKMCTLFPAVATHGPSLKAGQSLFEPMPYVGVDRYMSPAEIAQAMAQGVILPADSMRPTSLITAKVRTVQRRLTDAEIDELSPFCPKVSKDAIRKFADNIACRLRLVSDVGCQQVPGAYQHTCIY